MKATVTLILGRAFPRVKVEFFSKHSRKTEAQQEPEYPFWTWFLPNPLPPPIRRK